MIKKSEQKTRVTQGEALEQGEHARVDSLRPKNLDEFVGQKLLKSQLGLFLEAAKKRKESVEHLLFYGPPGLGKTTLAMIIAYEMNAHLISTSGPAIERQADLASLLTNLEEGDVLFIDEIHRLRSQVEEILYSAMEDRFLDIVIGKGPTARTMRIDLPAFTLVGATTKVGMVSAPLRDRFGSILKLDFYGSDEICDILLRSAKILEFSIERDATEVIANCSRRTPRVANRLLRRVRDYSQIKHAGKVDVSIVEAALSFLRVDSMGLDEMDRALLKAIEEKFDGGPVGVSALCATLAEEPQTLEDVYEPFLMQIGFMDRTPRGRVITAAGKKYLEGLKVC